MAKRTLIVGDLHGCYDEMLDLLKLVDYRPAEDRLIFTGDVINRGPQSKACIEFLQQHKARSVLGNHEYFMLQSFLLKEPERNVYKNMAAEFGPNLPQLIDEIAGWPVWIEEEDYLVIHAGLHPTLAKESTPTDYLVNVRNLLNEAGAVTPWFDLYQGKKLVVFGHWARLKGVVRDNVIGLDLGCVYGEKLQALSLPDRRLFEVPARQKYFQS